MIGEFFAIYLLFIYDIMSFYLNGIVFIIIVIDIITLS